MLFALLPSLSSSNTIVSFPTFTFTEPDVNINEPLATNPVESAGNDALSFVSVADNPSNIFTGVIFIVSENSFPNWSEPEMKYLVSPVPYGYVVPANVYVSTPFVAFVDTNVNGGFPLPEFTVNGVVADAKFLRLASIVII